MLPAATAEFYTAQQRRQALTLSLTRREWARMGNDFDSSWAQIGPRITVLTASAQLGAARDGALYVPKVLRQTNQVADPEGEIVAQAFAGIASDGRGLDSLLYGAVTQAKTAAGQGLGTQQSLSEGGRWLDMAISTMVADAGRSASGVGIASRPRVGGYVRMLNPPSCSRCAVLAGKWFKYNQGFRRHPRCDCVHIPSAENIAGDFRTDAKALFDKGQITGLSGAQTKALTEGADIGQVINATRGMSTTATVGGGRLTPEGIYRRAESRQEAIDLLKVHGYLT